MICRNAEYSGSLNVADRERMYGSGLGVAIVQGTDSTMYNRNGKFGLLSLILLGMFGCVALLGAADEKQPQKDPPKDAAKEPAKEPVKEPTKEPAKEPAKEPSKEPAKDPKKEDVKKDRFDDPLPSDALSRMGTVRWRQGSPMTLVHFMPDNKTVLTAGTDLNIRIWEASTGKLIRSFSGTGSSTPLDTGGVPEYMYNPGQQWTVVSADGKLVATASQRDLRVRIFEVESGKMLKEVTGITNGLTSMGFSPDGKNISFSQYDGSISLIDVAAGKIDKTWNKPDGQNRMYYGGMNGTAFSPDGKQLVTIGHEMENQQYIPTLKIWDVAKGTQLQSIRNPQGTYGFYTPSFSPDGKLLAWGASDGSIRVYDPATGKEVKKLTPGGQVKSVTQLIFGTDGKKLYTKSYYEQGFREFDLTSGKEERQLGDTTYKQVRIYYYNQSGGQMSVSKDGKLLMGVGGNNAVYMVDLKSGKEVPMTTAGHDSGVFGVQYIEDGKTIVTQGMDGSLRRWETATGKELSQVKLPTTQGVNAYSNIMSPDGKLMASSSYDGTVQITEAATGKQKYTIQVDQQRRGYMMRVVFSPDSKMIAVRSQIDPQVLVYSTETGKEVQKLVPATLSTSQQYYYGNQWQFMMFSPDSKYVAASGVNQDNSVRVWDAKSGNELRQFSFDRQKFVTNGAFSPDGRMVAMELNDSTVSLMELQTGKQRRQFGQAPQTGKPTPNYGYYNPYGAQSSASSVAFSPNGQLLAITTKDRKVRLWEIATGKDIGDFEGHQGAVLSLVFSPDSKTLTTGSSDTTALVWDVTRRDKNRTPRTGELQSDALAKLFKELDSTESKQAADAFASLWAAPKSTVPFLAEQVQPAASTEEGKIIQLITDLDNNRYVVRKKALDELEKMGDVATPQLKNTLTKGASVEVQKRITELLERVAMKALTAEQLRSLRVIELLEQIDTPESKEVLKKLAKGAPAAFLTTEAQAALARMGK